MINFSINKNLFLQALNTTKRAISHKNAIPILSTIKIDVTNEGITLIGSNGQISIENFISINNENAGLLVNSLGSILLEANFFINVISSVAVETSIDSQLSANAPSGIPTQARTLPLSLIPAPYTCLMTPGVLSPGILQVTS